MAITHDQAATATAVSASSVVLTWATPPTAGSKVIVKCVLSGDQAISAVDNGATPTTFTADVADSAFGAFVWGYTFRADNITLPSVGSYHVTITFNSSVPAVAFGDSWLGVVTGGPTSSNSDAGTGTSADTGAVTPAITGALCTAVLATDSGNNPETITLTSAGWTNRAQLTNGTIACGASADIIVSGTSAQTATWTVPDGPNWMGEIAVYSPAAVGPVTGTASIVQQVSGGEINNYGIGTTAITTTSGNGIVVFAGWDATSLGTNVQIPGISISDSAGNLWKQIDISAVSGATTETRGAIWITVGARSVNWVSVSVSGVSLASGWLIAEVSGLPQNVALDFALAANGLASSTSITGIGTAQGIGFALVAGASNALTVTAGPAGWTALTRVAQGNVVDGVSVMPYWNNGVAAGSNTLSFTFNGSDNFNVLYCQILSNASPPAQYSPQFPLTLVEAAFGAQPGLVSSSAEFTYSSEGVTWQDISSRVIGGASEGRMTASRGKQYELSQAESGTLDITLDNHDGAFTPTNPGSPYYSNAINQNMAFANGVTAPWTGVQGTIGSSTAFATATGLNAIASWSMTFTPDGVHSGPEFISEYVSVNQNYTYSFSFWIYSVAGWASGINATIAFYDSSKSFLGSTSGTTSAIPAATWTQYTVTGAVPPAGSAYAIAEGIFTGTPSAALFYISEAALVTGSSAVRTGQVALLTPIRVSAWWNGIQYPVWMGYVERWPQSWPEMPQWGFSKVTAIDAVGVMASITMSSALVSDVLIDNPYAYLPCNEQYSTAIVGATPTFQFTFGKNPYYAPSDANGLVAVNKALNNEITGVYSDGQAGQLVNTGVAMNFFGDDSTGVGATAYNGSLSGHRGPCMIYSDPGLTALTSVVNTYTVEFWFTWAGAVNTSINLLSMYGVPSSFWFNGANTFNGNNLLVWIKINGASNNLAVTLNQATTLGPAITPSSTPQHVVIVFNPLGTGGFSLYVNGTFITETVTGSVGLNTTAIGLGPATYSYDCANSSQIATYTSNNYGAAHLAVYSYGLPAGRIQSHWQTGSAGYTGVSAAFRFAQIASWSLAGLKRGGYYTLNATGVAESTQIGPAYSLNGSSAADGVNSVAQSEGGTFYVTADGTATYLERQYNYNAPNARLFGDNATSATAPLNSNPDFTHSVTGWTAFNGSLTSSGTAYAGSGSGLFTPSGSGGTATAYTSTFPAAVLGIYTGGAWILSPNGYGSVQTIMTWLNSSGGTVSSATGSVFNLPPNSWFFTTLGALGPAGVASGKFGIQEVSSPGTSNTFYISYGSVFQNSPEVPFLKETEFGFDNTFVYNEVISAQQDGPTQAITSDYRDTASQGEYFRRSALSFQQNVVSPYDVADITTWYTTQYKQPSLHLTQLKIMASANPLIAFPGVFGLDIGQLVTVTRRPVGGGIMRTQGVIERIQVEIGSRFWTVTYQISPYAPQGNVLCADTNGFNTPSTTILGW